MSVRSFQSSTHDILTATVSFLASLFSAYDEEQVCTLTQLFNFKVIPLEYCPIFGELVRFDTGWVDGHGRVGGGQV